MLQNIRILAGELPKETGDLKQDHREMRLFLERLLQGLERNFDQVDAALQKQEISTSLRSSQ